MASGVPWEALAERTGRPQRTSPIRDLLAHTARPSVISFAGGLPAPEAFPVEQLRAAADEVLRSDGTRALQYAATEGFGPLRAYVAERLARRGIACRAEDVLITTGSQQALDLIGRVLVAPGRPLLTESPTYVGALQAFLPFRPEVVSFPMDAEGLRVDELERWLEQRSGAGTAGEEGPSLLYTVPTYQNPSGVTMSLERRRALLEVARAWRLAVVEDDPYSELSFGEPSPPALRALPGSEEVIHLGTFSKILSPGLRVGWVVGPPEVVDRLATAKQGTDLHTDGLAQRIVLRWCREADVEGHIAEIRRLYARRRDVMLDALERQMPEGVTWTHPEGGMFVWLTLPEGVDSRDLLRKALERDVAFVPGTGFHADGQGARSMRLNFTNSGEEGIREGVRRLAETIGAALGR